MKRPFSTIAAILLVVMAALQGLRLWFGWPVTIDGMAVPISASATAIGIGLALAIGLWFEARMHANLAYYNEASVPVRTAPPQQQPAQVAKPFTVRKGARYQATLALAAAEQFARNDTIAALLKDAGFQDISVTGVGPKRTAEALWPASDTTGALPPQIVSVTETGPVIASQPRMQSSMPAASRVQIPTATTVASPPPPPTPELAPSARPPIAAPPPPGQAPTQPQRSGADAQPSQRDTGLKPGEPTTGMLKAVDPRSISATESRFASALGNPRPTPLESVPTPLRPSTMGGGGSVPSVKFQKSPTDEAD